jgi:cytochrome c-type biogenesis protein CcmH
MIKKIFILFFIFFISQNYHFASFAVEPEEVLINKKQEALARKISKNIRCMVCQNESIDESNAPLAKDLRILIRSKIEDGKNSDEIYKFLTDRYGDFILLKPPLNIYTFPLWFMPLFFFVFGLIYIFLQNKKSRKN